MTTSDADEQGKTAPINIDPSPAVTSPAVAPPPDIIEPAPDDGRVDAVPLQPEPFDAEAAPELMQPHTTYVPLAVTVGDGFKFGCGFFLALVLAMLVGFVLLAALFVLTTLFGLNLPITR